MILLSLQNNENLYFYVFNSSFTLANDAARMSVFRYNRAVDEDTQILLSDFIDDQAAFINAFDNIPYDGRGK